MTSSPSSTRSLPEDPIGAQLDAEISSLQTQISNLKSLRAIQTRTLLTSHTTQTILTRLRASQRPTTKHSSTLPSHQDPTPLLTTATNQLSHNQANLYRACASITTFRIHDPDPHAVDGGRVLGIRIDTANAAGRFTRPYYVMLNRVPGSGEGGALRVHRHTVPACIPLAGLAGRYLPEKGRQDLTRFVRGLRREIVGYARRAGAIRGLRREFGIDGAKRKERERVIVDISAADAEAKQVRIEWVDGRIGRCVVDDGGTVEKCVVVGEQGRDYEVERRILGGEKGDPSMMGIGERLREGIY